MMRTPRLGLPATMLVLLGQALITAAPNAAPMPGWMNPVLSPERRAALLEAAMTDQERLGLLHGHFPLMMKTLPAGVQLSAGYVPGIPRLGVPALRESDASLGVAKAGRTGDDDDAVSLPSSLSQAATWDTGAAFQGGRMIGREARAKGFNVLLAGGVNLVRDPRGGRTFEYMGEDPLLAGRMAGSAIAGIQSNHIVSTAKHFVLNAQETGRHVLNAEIDPAALRESDLLAFELSLERGHPGSIMCAYNRVNGPYACESSATLQIPKRDWGWPGWVMSDWGAVHSTRAAVLAGLDQESGQELDDTMYFGKPLADALQAGAVPRERLNDMVRRILWGLFSTGLMDDPTPGGALDVRADTPAAERTAEEGIVLLKDNSGAPPLRAGLRRILVIGGHADRGVLSGGGSSQVIPNGSLVLPRPAGAPTWGGGVVYQPSSPLDAIRARAGETEVTFDPGDAPDRVAALARNVDAVVVFATQWMTEGADAALSLPDGQDALIAKVADANPNTTVVLETGGPVFTPWLAKTSNLIEAWYPGSGGGEAIAKVLYGEVDASGRLPVSFPKAVAQLPRPELPGALGAAPEGLPPNRDPAFTVSYREGADVGYRWYERTRQSPAFPFGFGLSYTSFKYGGLALTGGRTLSVRFQATNTGSRPGVTVAQVYGAGPGQVKRLIGWARVPLKPGERKSIVVTPDLRLLADFDNGANRWRLRGAAYSVDVATSAASPVIGGRVVLADRTLAP